MEDPSIFAIALETLAAKAFGDMCSGNGSWTITTHQKQLISFIHNPGEPPLRASLMPRYITSQHTIHQASEEIISQRTPKPRLYIHIITVTKYPNTNNVSPAGHPSRTTASVYVSGLLRSTASYHGWLRRTTPDNARLFPDYLAGHRGSQHPRRGPAWALGKLPTRLPVSPVPVQVTFTVAGLGWDSRIYNGGGSSLCWSVTCALRPPDPN